MPCRDGLPSPPSHQLTLRHPVPTRPQLYLLLLFLRVLLSWFPTFDWMQQPWLALRQVRAATRCHHRSPGLTAATGTAGP